MTSLIFLTMDLARLLLMIIYQMTTITILLISH